MKRLIIITLTLSILIPTLRLIETTPSLAQTIPGVGIGTNTPHPSAILDIDFSDRDVLFPRMTTAERDAINSGIFAEGLLLYNMDDKVFQIYDGSAWQSSAISN
ncbi:MAG: hypothetical protein AAF702_16335 [Chloroflexota bacterium]